MTDSFAGYTEPAVPSKKLDTDQVTTAVGLVERQRIDSPSRRASDFADHVLNLRGYAFAAEVNAVLSAENDLLLFRNSGSKVIRLFEQVVSVPSESSTVRSVLRVYKNPTVTLNGTALTVGSLRNANPATTTQAFTLPTISARGARVQTYGVLNTPTQRALALTRIVEPGDTLLFTGAPSAANVIHAIGQAWAEVAA